MLNWLKRSLGGLLALCMLISLVPTALAADRSELEDHWASESLLYFADEGWLQGYKDGTYRPDSKISRAEFLTILNRVCGFTDRDDEAAKRFTDVKETDWYFEQVSIALAAGYTNGTSATTMSPRAQITRQEAFTMIARVAGVSDQDLSVLDKFSDADAIGNFAKPAIASLTAAGYVEGYKDGKLLVSVLDEANSWNEETGEQRPAELNVWDPAADTLTKLADAVEEKGSTIFFYP